MIISNLFSVLISLRLVAGSLTMAFGLIAILRLAGQYRTLHYSQSIYSIILIGAIFADALISTVALTIFVSPDMPVTVAGVLFMVRQWLDAMGMMMFSFYLIGIVNGFWGKHTERPELTLEASLP